MGIRRAASVLVVALMACACTLPPIRTPSPRPTATPSAAPTPSATPSPIPTDTPTQSPGAEAMPRFTAGEIVLTTIDGLRVRQRPTLSSVVVAGLLPLGAELEVVMGPILVGENGWYLAADAGADEPDFGEGWIASGFEPEPFLAATGRRAEDSPHVASLAQTGDAEHGPIEIPDDRHAIRWVALDPEGVRCQFSVLLSTGSAEPVPAIRATVGSGVVPGTLQQPQFAALGLTGQVFVTVRSDCAWALVIARVPDPVTEPTSAP